MNSDKMAPPGTDHGETINAQWPMALSRNRYLFSPPFTMKLVSV